MATDGSTIKIDLEPDPKADKEAAPVKKKPVRSSVTAVGLELQPATTGCIASSLPRCSHVRPAQSFSRRGARGKDR